jgi:hypothetical protein
MRQQKKLGLEWLEARQLFASDTVIESSALSSLSEPSSIAAISSASTPITTIKSGNWSDAKIWKGGVVPGLNDTVTIAKGTSVVMNTAQSVQSLDIAGSLTMTANLTAYGNVNVLDNAKLVVDDAFINFVVADDTVFIGGDSDEARNDTGLWIEGDATIKGDYKTPSLDLVPTKSFTDYKYGIKRADVTTPSNGQTLLKLSTMPINWKAGDELVIGTPEGETIRAQLLQIVIKIDGIYAAINSSKSIYALQANGQVISPKIVNLSRTAGVTAGEGHHKAHVMVLHHGELDASYAEFKNLGPEGKLGRYPIHIHHTHHASTIEGSSIWSTDDPSNRGIAIHDSSDNIIHNNVIFNVMGHGVFMEDPKGDEIGNQIIGNITMAVSGSTVITDEGKVLGGEEVVATPEMATYNKTAHYWVRPGNVIKDNIAIGGTAVGMVVMPGKGGTSTTINDFTAYGVGRYGIQAGVQVTWNNPIIVNADVSGYGSTQTWGLYDTGSIIKNPLFILNGENPDSTFITDTDRAYVSQIYLNQSRQVFVIGGFLAGKKGVHVHYSSAVELTGTKLNVGTLVTPTYYESDVLFKGCTITTDFLADFAYQRRTSQHGRIRIDGSTYNNKLMDKTFVSKWVAADAGLPILSSVQDQFGRDAAMEVPTVDSAGYVEFSPDTRFIRYRKEGAPAPTWWPVYYPPSKVFSPTSPWGGFSTGLFPGTYIVETFNTLLEKTGTYKVTIVGGKLTSVNVNT